MRILICLAVAGCLVDEPSTEVVAQEVGPNQCPIWECGSNSPEINNLGFHELNEAGVENDAGFRIVSFKRYGIGYRIDVRDGRLLGLDSRGNIILSAATGNLVDAQLLVQHSSGAQFLIKVIAVNTDVQYWAQLPVRVQPVRESYLLWWNVTTDGNNNVPGTPWKNVCNHAGAVSHYDILTNMSAYHTLLFDGDRIDAGAKTIAPLPDYSWFNLGCAGHALAKLELTGHTEAAQRAHGFATTHDERQTMLKMIVADYTGSGIPYTVPGQPLRWKDHRNWMTYPVNEPEELEARWTPSGAACLEEPRTAAHWTQAIADAFPNTNGDVEEAMDVARPPHCANTDPNTLSGFHLVSANPP